MTTLPFFDRQPVEAQYVMYQMAPSHTADDIIDAMKSYNVDATDSNIAYYRHINGINKRHKHIIPETTFVARIGQYIDAIARHHGDSWSKRSLGVKGAVWARCATKMRGAGMIRMMEGTRPVRYERIVGMEDIMRWYLGEVVG